MNAETWDYEKLGKTTWRATVILGDEADPWVRTLGWREIRGARSKGLAVAFINQRLTELDLAGRDQLAEHTGGYYWGRIERGTYLDTSFDDHEYGRWINDATWEPDHDQHGEPLTADAWIDPNGAITWNGP